ncbi:hypothetical protein D3C76_1311560 [compost metagenome]
MFSAVSDAPLKLQPEEVMEARFMSVDEALAVEPCCPDSRKALKLYLDSCNRASAL